MGYKEPTPGGPVACCLAPGGRLGDTQTLRPEGEISLNQGTYLRMILGALI